MPFFYSFLFFQIHAPNNSITHADICFILQQYWGRREDFQLGTWNLGHHKQSSWRILLYLALITTDTLPPPAAKITLTNTTTIINKWSQAIPRLGEHPLHTLWASMHSSEIACLILQGWGPYDRTDYFLKSWFPYQNHITQIYFLTHDKAYLWDMWSSRILSRSSGVCGVNIITRVGKWLLFKEASWWHKQISVTNLQRLVIKSWSVWHLLQI